MMLGYKLRWWMHVLASMLPLLVPTHVQAQPLESVDGELPRVSLLTFAPGEIYWQRFGHNALLLRARDGRSAVYNYGIFDFRQKNFFLNFARGRMLYRLDADSLYRTLEQYASEDRWVYEQQLDLSLTQRRALAAFLANNLRPENIEYRYDYLKANCSTRVRDALDGVLDGALRQQLEAHISPASYRREVTRLMSPDALLAIGMDLALGSRTDRALNAWELSFIPERLMQAVRDVRITEDGVQRPLVKGEGWLYRSERGHSPEQPLRLWPWFLVTGLLTAGLLGGLYRARRLRAARIALSVFGTSFSLIAGLTGVVMLAGWKLTDHWGMWDNQNLLLANPLMLVLIPFWIRAWRAPWRPGLAVSLLLGMLALMAVASLFIKVLPGFVWQQNLAWIALLMPPHLMLGILVLAARQAPAGFEPGAGKA